MKTIHLFFNGREADFPASNDWDQMGSFDTVRLFLACAESWQRNGWNVVRLSTGPKYSDPVEIGRNSTQVLPFWDYTPQVFGGRIATEGKWYPRDNWQLMAKCASLTPDDNGEIWVGSIDTFNFRYRADSLSPFAVTDDGFAAGCVSFQREHFSLSLICARKEWFRTSVGILADYDAGILPRIPGKWTSDETILRTYARHAIMPLQRFAGNTGNEPFVHFARPLIPRVYQAIPLI